MAGLAGMTCVAGCESRVTGGREMKYPWEQGRRSSRGRPPQFLSCQYKRWGRGEVTKEGVFPGGSGEGLLQGAPFYTPERQTCRKWTRTSRDRSVARYLKYKILILIIYNYIVYNDNFRVQL